MKILSVVSAVLFASMAAQASDFRVSGECRETIRNDLKKRGFQLTRINEASYSAGGSDGASSWDDEYVLNAYLKDSKGKSLKALVYLNDSYNCRVISVSRVF